MIYLGLSSGVAPGLTPQALVSVSIHILLSQGEWFLPSSLFPIGRSSPLRELGQEARAFRVILDYLVISFNLATLERRRETRNNPWLYLNLNLKGILVARVRIV